MLRSARVATRPALRLPVVHDDDERKLDSQKGARVAIARAAHQGWTAISITQNWSQVFAD